MQEQPSFNPQAFIEGLPQMINNLQLRKAQLKEEVEKVEKQLADLVTLQNGVNIMRAATEQVVETPDAPEYTEQDAE